MSFISRLKSPFNRTRLELKHDFNFVEQCAFLPFNRTRLELKH